VIIAFSYPKISHFIIGFARFIPLPDKVILFDIGSQAATQRKPEHTLEESKLYNALYRNLAKTIKFRLVIDGERDQEQISSDIERYIERRKVVAFLNAFSKGMSGGDVCLIELVKRMDKFYKLVVTSLLGKKASLERGLSADFFITSREQDFKNVVFPYLYRTFKVIFSRIRVRRGDILYASSDFFPDVLPAFFLKLLNRNVYWVQKIFHLITTDRLLSRLAQRISFFFISRFSDLIICDNNSLKKELVLLNFPESKIKLNSLGIDLALIKNSKVKPVAGFDAVFCGRLHPSKGIFDLVEIWQKMQKFEPNFKLGIIGTGASSIMKQLSDKIKQVNLDNHISLLGYYSGQELFSLLKSSKIFVFPSHEEGFGIAVAEAMACGLPVVAWDLTAYSEVFTGGMIKIEKWDKEKFAKTILELLNDRNKRGRISNEAKELVQKYDWDKVFEREEKLIESILL
jgi:glycosyltransferase involved in cell wall biosynthesis